MARSLTSLEQEIRELDPEDQEALLRFLIAELDGPPDPDVKKAWLDEAVRRAAEIDSGAVKCVPADKVFREIDALLKR
jgi:hypothetical protein